MGSEKSKDKISGALSGSLLETAKFGRSEGVSYWIEAKKIAEAGARLKAEPSLCLDWLEQIAAMQLESTLVLSYFLRSFSTDATAIIRISLNLEQPTEKPLVSSVNGLWPTAAPFESELSELFGIEFQGLNYRRCRWEGDGFPLRKEFSKSAVEK